MIPAPVGIALIGALAGGVATLAAERLLRRRPSPLPGPPPGPPSPPLPSPADALLEALPGLALARLDADGVVRAWSPGAARLLGLPADRVIDRPWAILLPPHLARVGHAEALLERARAAGSIREELDLVRDDGSALAAKVEVVAHSDASGALLGYGWRATDITGRRAQDDVARRHQGVLEAARRVEEAARLRGQLLNGITHDLRAPLTYLIGFAKLLHDERLGPLSPAHREVAGDILESGEHLLRLVNATLDLAKVEAGRMEFHPREFAPADELSRVVDLVERDATGRGVGLALEVDPDLASVRIDPDRFRQVVLNFVTNAVKVSPVGGRVTIRAMGRGEAWFRVEVIDQGPGIAPADVPRLFHDFQQLDPVSSRAEGGSGLGLALARRLVEAQMGRVGMHAGADGGCVFFAVLPRRPRDMTGPLAVYYAPEQPTVLVVQPDADRASPLLQVLREEGVRPRVAESGEAALEIAATGEYDAIILALTLPDMTGLDVLRTLRLEGWLRDRPVILLSPTPDERAVYGQGVFEVLRHPTPPGELRGVVRRLGLGVPPRTSTGS